MPVRPQELLRIAARVLDDAAPRFVEGVGAPKAVVKGHGDFATELDLELERRIAAELRARTGIDVHGEEFGGPPLDTGVVWVLDPIDGTYNYAAGLPLAGMLLGLVVDGRPAAGLIWLPLLNLRYAATADGPVCCNDVELPRLGGATLADTMIGFGAFNVDGPGRNVGTARESVSGQRRFAILGALSRVSGRVRMQGSTGVDLAFVAAGVLGGAVVFGHHPWDNVPGIALVRAAGGVVTDLAGAPWTLTSGSVLAAAPGVHAELVELIRGCA
ncbi:inositol monophosphatase family protein [Skermania piniformis]|uniref:Inositol monophosphatase family protein n=1 Tax=Skermania pinensis TaxID=39122 RepID=A0ABX8SHK2_9ACTN|nr:inositol monophosphatase family protein [Skermania piniformis]QXQ15151.1 inositol monophosphatase family protein [Skermania piniformis]